MQFVQANDDIKPRPCRLAAQRAATKLTHSKKSQTMLCDHKAPLQSSVKKPNNAYSQMLWCHSLFLRQASKSHVTYRLPVFQYTEEECGYNSAIVHKVWIMRLIVRHLLHCLRDTKETIQTRVPLLVYCNRCWFIYENRVFITDVAKTVSVSYS